MTVRGPNNDEQTPLWNGPAGHAWVEAQELLDQTVRPFEDLLVAAIPRGRGGRVLDVGCGTGSTTVAAARRLGADGSCIGIDISGPMIAAARIRAGREGSTASFVQGDAQTYEFEPGVFDLIISRFGVMFFSDSIQAFANLRRAAKDSGRIRFIAWRSAAENPFMTAAERAASPLLPDLPARQPDGPGQFAFADRQRVGAILEDSGWVDVDVQTLDVACTMPERYLVPYLTRLGPVGLLLREADERTRTEVVRRIRPAFDPYVHGDEVRFTAACWLVSARAALT